MTGPRAVMFREFRVNVLTLTLALAMERDCPSMGWHRDPEGYPRIAEKDYPSEIRRGGAPRARSSTPQLHYHGAYHFSGPGTYLVKKAGRSRSAPPEMVQNPS